MQTKNLPTLHTMSTMPSEKLPTMVDTHIQHSRSSNKDTGVSPTSINQVSST